MPASHPILRAGCLAAALLLANAAAADTAPAPAAPAAKPPPAASFFEPARFDAPKLSPNGQFLAARTALPDGRLRLSVVRLDDLSVKVVAAFGDADVGYFDWVNDQRLVFNATDLRQTDSDDTSAPGLFAVNRDGGALLQLVETGWGERGTGSHLNVKRLDWDHFLLPQPGRQDSDFVYVLHPIRAADNSVRGWSLWHLNTVSGQASAVPAPGAGDVQQWLLDQNGEPRLAVTLKDKLATVLLREGDTWRQVSQYDAYSGEDIGRHNFHPVGFAPDGTLYVTAAGGRDKSGMYRFDLAKGELGKERLVDLGGYDFTGELVSTDSKLLGASYVSDVHGTAWFEPRMQALQASVDALLPGRVNLLATARRGDSPWLLVRSYSDREPGDYVLYNSATKQLTRLGQRREHIDPARMGRQVLVHYKARDGLPIPAWITYPRDSARRNLPLVMLVHGGPYVRGNSWGWNPAAQFLASRGYAVMEPESRGSTGFGSRHFRAGWKQWGLAMQDDIADGAKWAAAQGIADPKRICIAGASYGGYATLMGLVNDPALYRCGVAWAGVTDIQLMYDGHWSGESDLGEGWKRWGMPRLVGDPVKDAAQLAATSPLKQAARIQRPLLLAYGGDDHRVPLYHGEKFYAAVKAGNPDVEWISYPKEGHGWKLLADQVDFWGRVEKFLDRHIGAAAGTTTTTTTAPR
ncbi:dipeptidyl aminopeptidase [Janthinobacterium sp. BJB412]|nr:dipeptidyl aminopeptidase [Janthinobacterium sp. BJB412]